MDVFEAMRRRRMHRRFTGEPVAADVLAKLVEAAALAPMGGNELVRRLILIDDPRWVKTVRDVTPSFLANPVAIIVVCTDLERAEASMGRQGRDILSLLDAGAAAENVALAAPALGIGISFVRCVNDSALAEVLELPAQVRVDILIGIGHPARQPSPAAPRREPVVFRNRFGGAA
jgi:5,6-dimethylbenzimidazole synthase